MLSFFLCPVVYLLLMCAPVIHSEINDENSECTDCIVALESRDPLFQKYIQIVLEAVQNTSEERLKIVNVENASYTVSAGILYEFTVHLTGLLQKINKTCTARVHQGYRKDDINIINLQCNEPEEVNECENCLENLDPKNPFLQKYLKLVFEEIKNRTKSDLRLLAVEDISFKVSNGVVFNFTLHLVDTTEELSTMTCNAIVHQGATIEEVNITTITCATEKIPECSDCEVDLKPDDPILGKYINITIEKLTENGTVHHFVGVKNPSYHVSNGIVYRFTIILTYGDSLENTKVCDAVVHQGYSHEDIEITQLLCITKGQDTEACDVIVHQGFTPDAIDMKTLQCAKAGQEHQCTDCEVSLNSEDSILTKYVNVALQTLQNKTGETPQLLGIQKASYETLHDGILYKLIITITYDEQKVTETCDVIVHQGFTPDAIHMKKLQCAKAEQETECVDSVGPMVSEPDDIRCRKYRSVTLKELQKIHKTLFHLKK